MQLQVIPGPVSKEEQLLWERKKCASWGITSYDLCPTSGRIVFPAGGSLFYCADPATGHTGPLFPYEIATKTSGARLNATLCPHNPVGEFTEQKCNELEILLMMDGC